LLVRGASPRRTPAPSLARLTAALRSGGRAPSAGAPAELEGRFAVRLGQGRYNQPDAAVRAAIELPKMPTMPSKHIVDAGPAPAVPYSRAVKAGGLIYLSGALAQDDSGAIAGRGDVREQTRVTIERLQRVLAAAGSSLADVLSVTVYLTSASDFVAMNEAYGRYWPSDPPARTTVITGLVVPEALIEISMIAVPSGGPREVVHPEGWQRSPNPYSYAVRSGDLVFLSGLVPRRGRDNAVIGGDIAAQTRAVLDNAAELLEAGGLTFADLVAARVYLTQAADFQAMNAVYREYLGTSPPVRATVQSGLAGQDFLVEMTFTASSGLRQPLGTPPVGVPLTPAVRSGNRLFLSGMLGNTPETAGAAGAQTRETLGRIGRTLEQAGASPSDVVDATVYVTDAAYFGEMNTAYREFFGSGFPARTTVVTPLVVPDGLVEIMVTAVAP
jgi:reactive intermediate/imine deaminase